MRGQIRATHKTLSYAIGLDTCLRRYDTKQIVRGQGEFLTGVLFSYIYRTPL